jgi:site-specific DNA-cytosine methylase
VTTRTDGGHSVYLRDQVASEPGSLNPDWVTSLMGFPDGWLDGIEGEWHGFPAPPGSQYDWEPPRTLIGKVPKRAQKLKALGNAVVPQCVEPIGRAMLEDLEEEEV